MSVAIIGLGTNLGAREAAVLAACDLLDARPEIDVIETSPLYETQPLGPPQGDYLNAALRLETSLAPEALLEVLLRIERRLGRRRSADRRWGPRSIDLDLLWDERGPHESGALQVPHRELARRSFALAPLLDVAPELAEVYGEALARLGEAPPRWERRAIVRRNITEHVIEVDVEADSLADVCALCTRAAHPLGRPWSTRHVALAPSPESFAEALRELSRTGFDLQFATLSHCSQSQWTAEFHGTNTGVSKAAYVRLQTTSGARRKVRGSLSIDLEVV
jgi:2-amino-4-hydroxy-6-hydroxymethyldihydropteridine diphosphokinase